MRRPIRGPAPPASGNFPTAVDPGVDRHSLSAVSVTFLSLSSAPGLCCVASRKKASTCPTRIAGRTSTAGLWIPWTGRRYGWDLGDAVVGCGDSRHGDAGHTLPVCCRCRTLPSHVLRGSLWRDVR